MSQDSLAKLECPDCKNVNYYSTRNRRVKTRLALSKHCKHCKKHTTHKETK